MKTVLVLFGGKSNEYEVSLKSSYFIINNIPRDRYDVITVGITKDGKWLLFEGDTDKIPSGEWLLDSCYPAVISPDCGSNELIVFDKEVVRRIHIDVCFPALHGKNGEDGTIQGLLAISGIPCVGCSTLSSAMCMDKSITNTIADYAEIPQAKWLAITKSEYTKDGDEFIDKCISYLGLPLFIKPANAGSSVGITKVKKREDMANAMDIAFCEDDKIVAEENITGREVECAVMGNDEPVASVVGEICPTKEFYDYNAKYIDGDTSLSIPAKLKNEKAEEVRTLALKAYKILGCRGLSRVDFFIRNTDEKVMFNEINTLPGFTSISMFPMLFEEQGMSAKEIVGKLIELSLSEV